MTTFVVDACSWINISNGDMLAAVVRLPIRLSVGPLTRDECGPLAATLDTLVARGLIDQIDDASMPAAPFAALLLKYGLGDGETECLALASYYGWSVATDDRAGRRAAKETVGAARLTGSLGLLRSAVAAHVVTSDQAWASYQRMVAGGGFLPSVTSSAWFR